MEDGDRHERDPLLGGRWAAAAKVGRPSSSSGDLRLVRQLGPWPTGYTEDVNDLSGAGAVYMASRCRPAPELLGRFGRVRHVWKRVPIAEHEARKADLIG